MLEPAYRLGFRLTNDKQDAEDLVQEAALRAFRFRHTFQRGSSFKAWFYRIVINQFYTGTRRKRNTTTSLDELTDAHEIFLYSRSAEAGLLRPDADPAAGVVSRMAEDDVARALATLPDEFRTVSTLYFIDDLSYQEIADILGVPIGTVRSRLHRGRHMLQKQLWHVAEELEVERHLQTCEGCLGRFKFEGAVLDELRVKLRRVPIPETLEARLRARLSSRA